MVPPVSARYALRLPSLFSVKTDRFAKRGLAWISLFLWGFLIAGVAAAGTAPERPWPPEGRRIRCPVIRDTGVSSAGSERAGNNGGARRLKLKGPKEFILLDIDPSVLKGKIVTGALLHMRSASPRKAPLARVGVSTLASRWAEGRSGGYTSQTGSSCFLQAEYKRRNWSSPGSTLTDVVFGPGNTLWRFADCTPPDRAGWQACAVDADVVAARLAGLSEGFCLSDEVGSTWAMKNGHFQYNLLPNRFCHSRESFNSQPWLEVWVSGTDALPPVPVTDIRVTTEKMRPGEALISWNTPPDSGGGRTLGFDVTWRRHGKEEPFPRYMIPMARPGEAVRMYIRDMPFQAGEKIVLRIRPADSSGNRGKAFSAPVCLAGAKPALHIPPADITPFPPSADLPRVGGINVCAVDLTDKQNPRNGQMIPERGPGYRGGNHLFSAKERRIRLQAARNEAVCFQLSLEGIAENIGVRCGFAAHPGLKVVMYQAAYVAVKNNRGKTLAILSDPLVPLNGPFSIPSRAGAVRADGQKWHTLICEVYVPHDMRPGRKGGQLTVSVGDARLTLDLDLTVWNFTLPDQLSFVPEMNAYGAGSPFKGYEYYRLAHEHRTCLNRLPYAWSGQPVDAPVWKDGEFDWRAWDKKMGPLLDGTAFGDLRRKGEPVDLFYLPLNENWPVSIYAHYRPSYWADEALSPEYAGALKQAFSAFASHCSEKGWHDTGFQFYLNNKVYYRKKSRRSSAPWIFDEPVSTQDFWALRWYGLLWRAAVDPVAGRAMMWFRTDIASPAFARNSLWGITDIEYVGGDTRRTRSAGRERQMAWDRYRFSEYGTANRISESNMQPILWCLSAWANGATGVVPWQTIGGENAWTTAEQTALLYPGPDGPCPSLRLKVFRRGQQDTEYLTLLCDAIGRQRDDVAAWLRQATDLNGRVRKTSPGDAGTVVFPERDPGALWRLRYRVGKLLSEKALPYRRSLTRRNPPEKTRYIHDTGYVRCAPDVNSLKPPCDFFGPLP
ncbi:hypothetical protein DENIS_0196 [Desulfonema ishimotonii]|uniref:Fibronectin type-III domain-containing protein n=2 Tax=Desulfonema ishimotonii TaxID=45657 RepID=A0A401FQM9_9BACT|nr:hypothetical protein DENIS_0196 [Desulfonema ishimotonii]